MSKKKAAPDFPGLLQLVDKRIVKRFFVFIWDPPHQADAFRGRSAEPPRR